MSSTLKWRRAKKNKRGVAAIVGSILVVMMTVTLAATFAYILYATYGSIKPPSVIIFNIQFSTQLITPNYCVAGNTEVFDEYTFSPSQPQSAASLGFRVQSIGGAEQTPVGSVVCPGRDSGYFIMLVDQSANVDGVWGGGGFYVGTNSLAAEESVPGAGWTLGGTATVSYLSSIVVAYSQTNVPQDAGCQFTVFSDTGNIETGGNTVY